LAVTPQLSLNIFVFACWASFLFKRIGHHMSITNVDKKGQLNAILKNKISLKIFFLFYVLKYFSKRKNCIKVIVEREEI